MTTDREKSLFMIMSRDKAKESPTGRGRPPNIYVVTDPNGGRFIVRNLKRFCEERSLNASNIIFYAGGYKGWKAIKARKHIDDSA